MLEEDPSAEGCSRRPLTVSEKARAVLVDLIASEGVPLAGGDLAVPMTRWAEKCEEEKISDCKERKHRTAEFKIAARKLVESKEVGEQEGFVWVA